MRYLKKYEASRNPKIGDYVIIDPHTPVKEVEDWILNHIGQIIDVEMDFSTDRYRYTVKYENIPKGWEDHFSYDYHEKNIRRTYKFGIEHYSKNKEDLERIIAINKYNL